MKFCPFCGNQLNENVKFCSSCGASLIKKNESQNKTVFAQKGVWKQTNSASVVPASAEIVRETSVQNTVVKENENKDVSICPGCGMSLSTFLAICPYCGREIVRTNGLSACKELCDKLEQIEKNKPSPKKNGIWDDVFSVVAEMGGIKFTDAEDRDMARINNSVEKQKYDAISRFIVPNNKSDLIEFLFMCESNVEAYRFPVRNEKSNGEYDNLDFKKLWERKYEETYRKASILLASDPDFQMIKKAREAKEQAEKDRIQAEIDKLENTFSKKLSKKIKNSIETKFNI